MKTALIQLNSGGDMKANIARIETLVAKAAKAGAEFIALPENAFLMADPHLNPPPSRGRKLYTMETHPGVKAAAALAKKHGVWLLAGSVAVIRHPGEGRGPRKGMDTGLRRYDGNKTYNRSLLFNPQGEIAAQYDKIHLFDVELPGGERYAESERMRPGGKVVIAKLVGSGQRLAATLGLTVCYDLRFPQLFRALAKKGAEVIAVPSAFTQTTGNAHWHVLLRARAIETGSFIIAPAQTGTHPGGRKTYGHSLIVDPWGKVLADGGTKEGVMMAEIDLEQVKKVRAGLPSLKHDREFL